MPTASPDPQLPSACKVVALGASAAAHEHRADTAAAPSPTPRPVPLRARTLGGLVHRTLAQNLPAAVSDDDIRRSIAAQLTSGSPIGPAMRNRAVTLCLRYTHRFLPAPPVRFLGAEIRHLDTVFDLAWQHPDGIWVDEIKTGTAFKRAQLHRELQRGTQLWGEQFIGVRVIPLGSPRRAFLARPATRA